MVVLCGGCLCGLLFGNLNNGVANGGLSYLNGNNDLSNANWNYLARLSGQSYKRERPCILAAAKLDCKDGWLVAGNKKETKKQTAKPSDDPERKAARYGK